MFWILIFVVAIATIYWLFNGSYKFWVNKGAKQRTFIPIFGDYWKFAFKQQSFAELVVELYNSFPNARYLGCFVYSQPALVLRDPDLIKQIGIKDFDHFVNHSRLIPEDCDPLWAGNLFALHGQKWREMRATLSPAFSSSKMKQIFHLISKNGEQFVNHFLNKNEDLIEVEMKDIFTRFTNDVIANTAFGIECDSLKDPTNEFFLMGAKISGFATFSKSIRLIGFMALPRLMQILKIRLYSVQEYNFFKHLVESNIQSREKHGIVRQDMMHLLIEAKKGGFKQEEQHFEIVSETGFATVQESDVNKSIKKILISNEDIMSQALVFFFAGFESVSGVMAFLAYELGINSDIQEKLLKEIDKVNGSCKGKPSYENILNIKYLDMVVSETLRKWPTGTGVDRVCTKPYTIQPQFPDEKPIQLQVDDMLFLPIFAIHRDAKFYPNPEKFDPERFNEENRSKITPYSYLPFGLGPRNCVGSRFALLEIKVLFFYVLKHFTIVPIAKTEIPLQISKKTFHLIAANGFWLGFKRRNLL